MTINHIQTSKINPLAIEICSVLQKHEYQAYIVGGCVRDLLLDNIPKDWDITTNAKPEKVMELFPKHYPTGLQHGTITVAMGEGVENHFEITTFRVEGKYTDGRRPEEVSFVDNIIDDLARRDLTINAMAYDPISKILLDPFCGKQDLEDGIITAVGNANERFKEDGLRIMRAARFAARFGFKIDGGTLNAMTNNLHTLSLVSKERIKDELCKTLMTNNPSLGLKLLHDTGILVQICPILTPNSPTTHFIPRLDNCKGDLETRVACLYVNVQVPIVKEELINLKFSNGEIKRIIFLLNLFDEYDKFLKSLVAYGYRQFIAFIKNNTPDEWVHSLEQFTILSNAMNWHRGMEMLDSFKDEIVWARNEMQINGNDLIEIGIKPGPELKKLLDKCYDEILEYPKKNTRDKLLEYVRNI
jgi:tRNA nucleotidyltransferase (CCA-adding enzyme)